MNKRYFLLRTALSLGVSLVVLGLIMRFSFGEENSLRPHLFEVLRGTLLSLVVLYFVFSLLQAFFRALRYRLLIRAAGEHDVPSLLHIFMVTLARNMFVDLLPARLGELSYIAMMNRGCHLSGKACVSSLTISFLFDLIALVVLLAVIVIFQLVTSGLRGWLLFSLLALAFIVLLMTLLLFVGIRAFAVLARRMTGRAAEKGVLCKMFAFLDGLADAVEFTRRSGVLLKTLGLSILVRASKYTALCALFYGVTRPAFPGLADASVAGVLCALVGAEAGASLPIPAFMSFGTYEAGGLLALTLLGFSAAASKISMLVIHVWSQSIDYALGGTGGVIFFLLCGPKTTVVASWVKTRRLIYTAVAALVLLSGFGFLGLQCRRIRKLGALTPPGKGAAITPDRRAAEKQKAMAGNIDGFMVWSSNRSGNHDLWMMTFPERVVMPLTTHPHVDTFPRISPDGRRVVFCRSQQPWVSQRNDAPWDVYVLNLAENTERHVASNANVPTWSDTGTQIFFQRNSGTFVSHDLETGAETTLFSAGSGRIPRRVHLQTPSFSAARNAMAVTLRGRYRRTTVFPANGGEPIDISRSACQLAWAPDSSFLYYVDHGGKQKTAFHRCQPDGTGKRLWLDSPGDYSHEYFPKLSNNKEYLVFGASTGGHEHDTADYEIFLWKVDDPAENAVRLTFHSGNDCWPDLYVTRPALHARSAFETFLRLPSARPSRRVRRITSSLL